MNIIDVCIILFLGLGAVLGFKNGFIKSGITFVGTLIIIILSYYLKNPVSIFLYRYLPFFNYGGVLNGISVFNIIVYEGIAFLLIFSLLAVILRIIIKVSGIIESILKFTIILAIPSKILGGLFGACLYYIITFVILYVMAQFSITSSLVQHSNMGVDILSKTPILSKITGNTYNSVKEIYDTAHNCQINNLKSCNRESLDILLHYKIIEVENAEYLIKKGKISISDPDELLNKYRED